LTTFDGNAGATGLSPRTASGSIGAIGDSRLALTKNDEEPNGIKLGRTQPVWPEISQLLGVSTYLLYV
jgi:hypothetical protein